MSAMAVQHERCKSLPAHFNRIEFDTFGGIYTDKPIKCTCGKLLARVRDGKLCLWCKSCKKEVTIKISPDLFKLVKPQEEVS